MRNSVSVITVGSGIKGVQLAGSMKNAPATITKIIAATLSITIKLFAFAAPLVPLNNIEITTRTMIKRW